MSDEERTNKLNMMYNIGKGSDLREAGGLSVLEKSGL